MIRNLLRKDEEIFVCYNYTVTFAPEWYQQVWLAHLRQDEQYLSEQNLKIFPSQNRGWDKEDVRSSGLQAASNPSVYNKLDAKARRSREERTRS